MLLDLQTVRSFKVIITVTTTMTITNAEATTVEPITAEPITAGSWSFGSDSRVSTGVDAGSAVWEPGRDTLS